ncbi:probable Co/Zn/Cd efflux system membrane fusion protein [alpha proteobacterium U9-1i]|nr:probable Co/Zn/Cd efflux system membrane fusion protein [alpha proteobacterium U9-1i]
MLGIFKRYGFAGVVAGALALMTLVVLGKSLFAGGDAGAGQGPPGMAQMKGKGGPGGPGGGALVTAAAVSRHTFSDAIQALGTAQARESIVLTPKVADTIRRLRFESGDRVRSGQVLVELASVEQSASLAEANAANAAAQEELRRAQELFDRGFASQARLDTVRAAADAAAARVNAGASRFDDRTIRAPFSGVVGLRLASPGQYVRPGDQIGTLDDLSQIKLDFDVPETRLAQLAPGVAISALTAAYPDRTFDGTISQVDSRVDPTTRTVRVRALLPNPGETIRPGMLMTVQVRSNPRQALAVPEIAVLDQIDGAYVYRVRTAEGGPSAEQVRVQVGQRSGGMAEILAGVAEGDQIITQGVQSVRPGQPVRFGDGAPGDGGLRDRTPAASTAPAPDRAQQRRS